MLGCLTSTYHEAASKKTESASLTMGESSEAKELEQESQHLRYDVHNTQGNYPTELLG